MQKLFNILYAYQLIEKKRIGKINPGSFKCPFCHIYIYTHTYLASECTIINWLYLYIYIYMLYEHGQYSSCTTYQIKQLILASHGTACIVEW